MGTHTGPTLLWEEVKARTTVPVILEDYYGDKDSNTDREREQDDDPRDDKHLHSDEAVLHKEPIRWKFTIYKNESS